MIPRFSIIYMLLFALLFRQLTRPTSVLDADKGDDLFRAEPSPGTTHSPSIYSHWISVRCTAVEVLICSLGLLNSVRRGNLDRYIVSLKQKAREGAGKRALSTVSPSVANKQMAKVFFLSPFPPLSSSHHSFFSSIHFSALDQKRKGSGTQSARPFKRCVRPFVT